MYVKSDKDLVESYEADLGSVRGCDGLPKPSMTTARGHVRALMSEQC